MKSNEIRKIANKISIDVDPKDLVDSLSKCAKSVDNIVSELNDLKRIFALGTLDYDFGQDKKYGYNFGSRSIMAINRLEDKIKKIRNAYSFAIHNKPNGEEFVESF
jgi:hypothetical protein